MVVVTDREYYMDNLLIEKLNLMVDRSKRKMDNLILIDGDEGYGKSNLGAGICHYFAWKSGRAFDVNNVFFELDKAIQFAKTTVDQIIFWDEGALGGLASEWWKKNQIEFIKLLMIARKKRHFFVICIPKFFKLNEYLVVDRSIALVHVYARNEIELGRFVYYGKKSKERLFNDWRKTKQRNYKKYYNFRGSFLEYIPKVIDEDAYEAKKDYAILNFNKKKDKVPKSIVKKIATATEETMLREFRKNFMAEHKEYTIRDMARWFNVSRNTIQRRLTGYEAR